MLQINRLFKSFPIRGTVLNNLSLTVSQGDSVSVSGPSGTGKTTLLNIIGLLEKPDSGIITFRGKTILDFSPDESANYRNRNIGFVFQEHLLLPYLTVKENILLPLLAGKPDADEYNDRVTWAEALMEKTGISGLSGKYPFSISGGEAQRAALVRALVNKPSLLLADEPTGSLDRKNAENLGEILTEMNGEFGITLILATHSASLADKMKTRFRLEEGALITDNHS